MSFFLQLHVNTETVKDRSRSERPILKTGHDDRQLIRRAKASTFTHVPQIRHSWPLDGHVNVSTLIFRLHRGNIWARRVVSRNTLKQTSFQWAYDNGLWNMRICKTIHWLDESRFLFRLEYGNILI